MKKYYNADYLAKMKAATVIQRGVRKFLDRNFDFRRAMSAADRRQQNRIKSKLLTRKKVFNYYSHDFYEIAFIK